MWQMLAGLALNKLGAKNQQSNQVANNFTPDVNNINNNMNQLDWNLDNIPQFKGFGGF